MGEEDCWFKLKHTHYPAPDIKTLGTVTETGPICLGHVISDLRHLDQVLNRGQIKPFTKIHPEDDTVTEVIKIWPSKVTHFDWSDVRSTESQAHVQADVPMGGTGVAGKAKIQAIFRESVADFEHFESLDYVIFQPGRDYAMKAVKVSGGAKEEMAKQKLLKGGRWTLYMVTGLVLARNGSYKRDESKGRSLEATGDV